MLDDLLAAYPDASVIVSHRDPAKTMPSTVSMTAMVQLAAHRRRPGRPPGRAHRRGVHRRPQQPRPRRDDGSLPGTYGDVRFADLMADPVASIEAAYAQIGREIDAEHRQAVLGYLEAKPRGKHGTHSYTAADWGFDVDTVRRELAPYLDRFAVPLEPRGVAVSPARESTGTTSAAGVAMGPSGSMKRQKTRPNGRPSVLSQFGTPGSRWATTIRTVPSSSAHRLGPVEADGAAQVVEGLHLAVPEADVGAPALGPSHGHHQGLVRSEEVRRHGVGGVGRGERVGAGRHRRGQHVGHPGHERRRLPLAGPGDQVDRAAPDVGGQPSDVSRRGLVGRRRPGSRPRGRPRRPGRWPGPGRRSAPATGCRRPPSSGAR